MLYEVVLTGSYFNQQTINRWNYLSTSTPSSVTLSYGLAYAFGGIPDSITHEFVADSPMWHMAKVQNVAALYIDIIVKAIYDPFDFYTTPFFPGQAGLRSSGDNSAPFMAYGFKSTVVRTDIKSGQKRLVGVAEGDVGQGGVISGSITDLLQNVADVFSIPLIYDDEGATLTYTPCVVQKQKPPPTDTWKGYRYYPTLGEQVPGHVAQNPIWSYKPQVRTQVSRQYGRGS